MGFRLWQGLAAFWLCCGALAASVLQPAEPPPPDFAGRQYIDSRGCIFMADGAGGWVPRLYDGELLCGYPPTLSVRQLASRPPDPARGRQVEQVLAETLFAGLRDGELEGSAQPFRPLPDMGPEPASDAPALALQAEIAAQPQIRRSMAGGLRPNRNLCRLLGHDGPGDGPEPGRIGQDPTEGFCDALPGAALSRLAFARPATLPQPPEAGPAPDPTEPAPQDKAPQLAANAQPAAPPAGAASPRPAASPAVATPIPSAAASHAGGRRAAFVDGIPPGARFVQLATVHSAAEADQVARHILALGYRPHRLKPGSDGADGPQVLLAGPFDDRQSIVIALDRLRRAGFRDAMPR
ncbi:SPOR domain-containing protein [uncultured Paracoccus sp.]|uniref:SPOR domain-containing protein n=1 Tax=uncultured Paracoccus sp. TaxID=189685 RepID=UPI0025FB1D6E|nr:SPOR domain-containing protein [uncultured Paracoccus sp.]